MHQPSQTLTTRHGFTFHVRPARPEDDGTVAEFFTHVTREDLRFRFLTGMNEVAPAQITALTHVDHRWTENYLAFTHDGATMIATAMLACDPGFERGEVAIALRKDFKQHGIGWTLLAHIAAVADTKDVKVLEAIESRDNHAAIEVERDMGFTVAPYPGDGALLLVSRSIGHAAVPA
ncbi:GNAT family N-acetyltransferase [Sphingomonas sp. 10B4]|uniref:GNAT family N-acetyltransferase n=1 Tax=Sphingomonas sp. 10B4 TaxID=3048575 RepID=UPI002AB3A60E|nr:GNAT family N-acetyltransferase [Sphingomonas sp. 10B4]MDY7525824.1 GNAT family N-acetyltransferase [Sphingomonas sp. 10B4]MEB0281638.1 GNAT family N-acetyltransferase [Sphingomonas sp. 10B4]